MSDLCDDLQEVLDVAIEDNDPMFSGSWQQAIDEGYTGNELDWMSARKRIGYTDHLPERVNLVVHGGVQQLLDHLSSRVGFTVTLGDVEITQIPTEGGTTRVRMKWRPGCDPASRLRAMNKEQTLPRGDQT